MPIMGKPYKSVGLLVMVMIVIGLLMGSAQSHIQHKCSHDTLPKKEERGRTILSYLSHPHEPEIQKKRAIVGQNYAPIRTHIYTDQLDIDLAADTTKLNFLKNTMLPWVKTKLSEMLSVIPVDGNFHAKRFCTGRFPGGQCVGYIEPLMCGQVQVPVSHILSEQVCPSSPSSCSSTTGGAGIPDTDLVIYVTAQDYGSCTSGSTLAFASHCTRDQYDRPVTGYVNFCKDLIDVNDAEAGQAVTLHEITHVLGISSGHWAFFRDTSGNPRTARNSNGYPPYGGSGYIPDTNTLASFTERGHTVSKLVTETVLTKVRDHFNCPTLNGLEIEDGGGSGTAGSHPDQRIFHTDYMCGIAPVHPVISAISLAILADTNWYKVNFGAAERLSWGKDKGCNFAMDKCLTPTGGTPTNPFPDHFCTSNGARKCTQNLLARGYCGVYTYTGDLPTYQQYFSGTRVGGSSVTMDYCPVYALYNEGGKLTDCRKSANAPTFNTRGETYSSSSRCVDNTLRTSSGTNSFGGGCYQVDCTNTPASVDITVGGTTITCSSTQEGTEKSVSGFGGTLVCPVVKDICPPPEEEICANVECDHGSCDTLTGNCDCVTNWQGKLCDVTTCSGIYSNMTGTVCTGHGYCSDFNNCTCNSGWTGSDCELFTCENLLPGAPGVCSGHGTCIGLNNCTCTGGYSGSNCEKHQCGGFEHTSSAACSGQGTCSAPETCTCSSGFTGEFCSCIASPNCTCLGKNDTITNTTIPCNCTGGYTGSYCDIPICDGKSGTAACNGPDHGSCTSPGNCTCTIAYKGDDCNVTSQCEEFNYCGGRGFCQKGICVCTSQFHGDSCQHHYCFGVASNSGSVCSSHGTCTSTDNCTCTTGYTHNDCSVHTCNKIRYDETLKVCSGHGSCTAVDTCVCNNATEFGGTFCGIANCYGKAGDNPLVCSGRGKCEQYNECTCNVDDDGYGKTYIGSQCEKYECPNRCPDLQCDQVTGQCLSQYEVLLLSGSLENTLQIQWMTIVLLMMGLLFI